ncbi:hypothetical protein ABEB36_001802 [Hypothenemus hampei]|uniref:Phosphodiesterase n=1 Tax=Hypothenemus hampei TaxID=57062 RepID=A0ABD1FFU3_HYPHA
MPKNNVVLVPVELLPLQRAFSKEDWVLLDAMGVYPTPQCSGKFLTMHKRRRKRLTTRALSQDHAILDDVHHGLVQRILDRCNAWAFNAFTLETVAGGRSLPVLCVHLFHWYGLLDHFQLDVVRVWKLFTLIEEGYHSTNPYHNSIHATDVTQAMHCFLQEEQIKRHVTPLEIMASLIGAVAHDLDHPGVNQHFLITTSNHLAILYQNMSVLENHHWRSAIGCLLESGVADQLLPYRVELEQQIKDLILATDINRQEEFLNKFQKHIDENSLDLGDPVNRQFILQIALKCADISNPTRPWDISYKWSIKVCEEFFRQGDFERELGLPITSICDKQSTSVAKIQVGFFRFVVTPLFSEWHRFMNSELSTCMMEMLNSNRGRWEEQKRDEQAEETQTELFETEPAVSDEEEPTKASVETSTSIHDFIPPFPIKENRRQSLAVPTLESLGIRRHSVPVHMEIPASGASPQRLQQPQQLPRTIYRRESLPATATIRSSQQGRSPVSPQTDSRASSGLREEDELLNYGSQSSLMSSGSPYHSSEETQERPLSAENLLPEPSIASMSSSTAIRHLTSILQNAAERASQATVGSTTKCLTRQQTFPPPLPYMRTRYLSATVEMTTCPETAHEGESRSTSSHSSKENLSRNVQAGQQSVTNYPIPAIAVLSPNNSRPPDLVLHGDSKIHSNNNKRETDDLEKDKDKRVKLSEETTVFCEKENLDPKQVQTSSMVRRGSAPVSLSLTKPDDFATSHKESEVQALRRGSVPIADLSRHFRSFDEDNGNDPSSSSSPGHILNITPVETNRTFWQYQRRGSAPLDLPPACINRYEFTRHTSLNGKTSRGRGKKQLRRRSSGGPETVVGGGGGGGLDVTGGGGSDILAKFCAQLHRRITPGQSPDALQAQRRGSLPLEVLTVGHSVM